jgi:hypothetical protein
MAELSFEIWRRKTDKKKKKKMMGQNWKIKEKKLGGKILIFKELYIIIFLKIFEKNMMAGGPQE